MITGSFMKKPSNKQKKKTTETHIYADQVMADERKKKLKFCMNCDSAFLGRPSFCPGCIGTERKLRKKI